MSLLSLDDSASQRNRADECRMAGTSIVGSIGMLQEILNAGPGSREGKLLTNAVKSAGS